MKLLENRIHGPNNSHQTLTNSIYSSFIKNPKTYSNTLSILMEELTCDDFKTLVSFGVVITAKPGDVIFTEGLVEKELYIVLSGKLELQSSCKSNVIELKDGDIFGEVSFFTKLGTRSATVTTLKDSSLLMLSRSFLKNLSKTDKELAIKLLFNMTRIMAEEIYA